ncbi:MAG: PorV/PorQ family protein [Elusimicrobiota bacterium]
MKTRCKMQDARCKGWQLLVLLVSIFLYFHISCLYTDESTDALPYLRMGVGARASGLGGAFTSIANDGSAVYWNPAGLTKLKKIELSSMYGLLSLDRSLNFLSASYSISENIGTIGLGVLNAGIKDIKGYDENNQPTTNFNYQSFAGMVSYSRTFTEGASAGLTIKFISDKLKDSTASGIGGDIGFLVSPTEKLNCGLMLQDIYTSLSLASGKKDTVPMSSKFGLSYKLLQDKMTVAADINKVTDQNSIRWQLGSEYTLQPISLRLGLNQKYPSAGFSINIWNLYLDYGYTADNLKEGDRHFVSIRAAFGSSAGETFTEEKKVETKEPKFEEPKPVKELKKEEKKEEKPMSEASKRNLMRNHYNRAVELYSNQKYEEAIKEWQEVLKLDPNHQPSQEKIEKAKEKLGK